MPLIKQYWRLILELIGVLIFILILSISTCKKPKDSFRELYTQTFKQKLEGDSVIATQNQLLVLKNDQIIKDAEKISGLKNIKAQVIYRTKIIIRDSIIPFTKEESHITLIDTTTKETSNYLQVPMTISKVDSFFFLSGFIDTCGLIIDSVGIPEFNTRVDIGDSKKLFKNNSVVKVTFNNPYIKVAKMNNMVVNDQLVKNEWKTFGIGMGTGVGVSVLVALLSAFLHK